MLIFGRNNRSLSYLHNKNDIPVKNFVFNKLIPLPPPSLSPLSLYLTISPYSLSIYLSSSLFPPLSLSIHLSLFPPLSFCLHISLCLLPESLSEISRSLSAPPPLFLPLKGRAILKTVSSRKLMRQRILMTSAVPQTAE